MKLSEWAQLQSITYRTAWEHFRKGFVPGAYQLPTGTIVVPNKAEGKKDYTVCYARVSSSENRTNLDTQAQRLIDYCSARGYQVQQVVKECASGLNDNRSKLTAILKNPVVTKIVVEHSDRLTRFGLNYLTVLLEQRGCTIEIINQAKDGKDELMRDFISLVTSFCARLYGQRRSQRKTEQLIRALENENHKV